ncbi:response regulator transcription factor [Haloarchaeobius sp. DFWS5]|uniref:response regulator transcription factor n=1 Tax=Haloarchaeobius sp. DFWS5 TaxID=3446114 RepID=UPI003EB71925
MLGNDTLDDVTTLVVDDEKEVADAYALRLRGFCTVETVYGGAEALAAVEATDPPIDVVLLDRHMPKMSGDDVLAELRAREFDGRIVMVTAVDPDFDVLDMPFDDYLCKPVDREDVRAVVDQQRRILAYQTLGEYFSAESKRAVVEAETSPERRDDHEGYAAISRRAATLEQRARRLLDDDTIFDEFERIGREEL